MEVPMVHEDVNINELQNVSQRPSVCVTAKLEDVLPSASLINASSLEGRTASSKCDLQGLALTLPASAVSLPPARLVPRVLAHASPVFPL